MTVLSRRSELLAPAVSEQVGALSCTGVAQPRFGRTRAYLPAQDGCSFSCSYCVIPHVRGASRSRSAAAVLAEARRRAAQGHRELVLTGVNLGCFRDRGAGLDLAGLLEAVAAVDGVERVRLSSIEVNHLSDSLSCGPSPGRPAWRGTCTCRCSRALTTAASPGRCGATTPAAGFLMDKMHRARELVEGINLTSDVIVGHPSCWNVGGGWGGGAPPVTNKKKKKKEMRSAAGLAKEVHMLPL